MSTLAAPVSYPVRRLEIHGQSPRLYESAHPPNVLTVTIESQQLRGSHRQGLVLIAYSGTHRLVGQASPKSPLSCMY